MLLAAIGVLFGFGLSSVALGLIYAVGAVAMVAAAVGAVRALRAGAPRRALWDAAMSVFLLAAMVLLALGWDIAMQALLAVTGGGLLVVTAVLAIRRWRAADPVRRRELAQSVALAVC